MVWDKETEFIQTMSSVERLVAMEKQQRDARYLYRKHLDKNNTQKFEATKQSNKAEKIPNITGPVSIEALGTNYPLQRQKQHENDMR